MTPTTSFGILPAFAKWLLRGNIERVLDAYITAFEYSEDGLDELDGNNHNPLWEHSPKANETDARGSDTGFELAIFSASSSDANATGSNPMHGPGGRGGQSRPGEHERDRPSPKDFRLSTGVEIFDPSEGFDISSDLDGYQVDEHADSFHVASVGKAEVCERVQGSYRRRQLNSIRPIRSFLAEAGSNWTDRIDHASSS